MSKKEEKKDLNENTITEEAEKVPSELDSVKEQLEKLQKEKDELNDRYLRTLAEYDNFRKRSQKEKDQVYGNAVSDTLEKLLDVLDAFDRASSYECADTEYKKGIDLIGKSVKDTFDALGVKEIPALGEQFNPDLHNAMMHIEDDAYGENEITEVYKKGYTYGDKVIRFSSVIVAN